MRESANLVRWASALALAAALGWPQVLPAAPIVINIHDYVLSVGKRADYFDGKLLTSGDLGNDQEYMRGTKRYLGDPAVVLNDPTLTLGDLFDAGGRADVVLGFNSEDANADNRSDPFNPQDPHHDDLIFLDPAEGRWRGRLYLAGVSGIEDGVYDDLSGSFQDFVAVHEPASAALAGLGLVGLWVVRRRRTTVTRQRDT